MKLFIQNAGKSSYGLSAGYLKTKDAGSASVPTVTQSTVETTGTSMKSVEVLVPSSKPKSYGFSSAYIRQKNQELRLSSSEVTPVVAASKPSVPVNVPVVPTAPSIVPPTPVVKAEPTSVVTAAVVAKAEPISKEEVVNEDDSSFLFLTNLKYEQQAKKSAALEVEQNSKIMETTESFRTSITRSIAKKVEAENIIIEELTSLQPLITNEIQVFGNRVRQLQQVSSVLETSYRTKEKQISQELELLAQMQQIRDRISERNILSEYDRALGKKKELIQVDQELFNSLAQVIKQLSEDALLCQKKQSVLAEKLNVFPSLSDREALLKYSWSDIADIQSVFSTSETTKAWNEADMKVQSLIASISSAESRRTVILEEVRTFESQTDPTSAFSKPKSSRSSRSESTSLARIDDSVFQSLSLSGGLSLVRVKSSDMRSLVETKTAKEMAFMAVNVAMVIADSLTVIATW